MILAFRVGPAANERVLFDKDRALFRVAKSKTWEVLSHSPRPLAAELTRNVKIRQSLLA